MAETDRIRLHISPFNATLYENIIPKSLQPNATNVSFHEVQTFPERGFGFVELPRADADKLRKKLNGATLRGQKMAIQEAKPEKRRRRDKDDAGNDPEEKPRKKAKKEKSTKKKDKEIVGFELPDERQVKRGWTEEPGKHHKDKKDKASKSTDKKDKTPKREKSKYSSKPEVLFKQKLPESVMLAQKAEGKEKKNKKTKHPRNITIIHEFEKNKPVPSFLKSEVSTKATATSFVPAKGWVDAEGNVVEEVNVKPKREDRIAKMKDTPVEIRIKPTAPKEPALHKDITAGAKALGHDASSDDSSDVTSESDEDTSDDSDDDEEAEEEKEAEREEVADEIKSGAEEVASLGPEAQEEAAPAMESEAESAPLESEDESGSDEEKSTPSEEASSPKVDAMDVDTASKPSTPPREIHPLEALFKKKPATDTTPRPAPINTSFSFGITDDIDEDMDADADLAYPSTPYTRTRDIRSAAPTPDTAAIGRKFSFSFANQFNDEDVQEGYEDEEYDNANQEPLGVREKEGKEGEEETEFAKWFWENRGDSNRAWKKRRRDVMKQKRQRENRRVSRRVV